MLAFFLIVLGVPLVVAAGAFIFLDGITWKEFGLIILAQAIIAGSSAGIVSCANTHDVEVWNGRVASKERNTVSCSHSYPCNCRQTCTGSGKNQSCSTTCDTCYEHFWDYDWDVHTTNGELITIERVDRQGVHEPPRFTRVKIGEPTSIEHSYVNYVKAAPDSLFRHQGLTEKYAGQIPKYPDKVWDYYHVSHLVEVGVWDKVQVSVPNPRAWNEGLAELNADLGARKQVNIIVVIVGDVPQEYFYALEEAWIGGKKNDAILVVSVERGTMKPRWASVMAWTSSELFKVKLRDDIMALPSIDHEPVLKILRTDVGTHYVRKPMKEFEYLSAQIKPSVTQWVLTLILGLAIGIGLIIYFQANDPFGDEGYSYGTFRRRRSW